MDALGDGSCVSQICRILKSIGSEYFDEEGLKDIHCSLVQILFEKHMSNADWFEVAESAVGSLYALFPNPDELFEEILYEMSSAVHPDGICPAMSNQSFKEIGRASCRERV